MKQIKEITGQQLPTLTTSSGTYLPVRTTDEISVYKPGKPSEDTLRWAAKTLVSCYPDTKTDVIRIICERLKAKDWTDERIKDAVHNLIDTHPYRSISPADVISFDKRIKLYTYSEVCNEVGKGASMKDYKKLKDRKVWTTQADAEAYGLT